MASTKSRRKVGIFSHGGTKNLGDEALISAVIQNVRLRVPHAEVVGFTINPSDSAQRHGIPCYPIRQGAQSAVASSVQTHAPDQRASKKDQATPASVGIKAALKSVPGLRPGLAALRRVTGFLVACIREPRFLVSSYRNLRGVELLLVAGSQQLNDGYGGPWGFPFTLLKWTFLSRLAGTKVAILSVGAGPLNSPLSRFFIRRLLGLVDYRSYRDAISSRLMETIGVKGEHPVFPDLVYSLQLPQPKAVPPHGSRIVVGTNPVPFFDGRYWPTEDRQRYQDYVSKLAKFAIWLEKQGHSVLFFPTQVRADVLTIDDIRRAMNGSGNSENLLPGQAIQTLEDLVSEISRADLVVANRYHGILISLMMNKPVLGVAYHEKSRALLAQAGQGDFVLDISSFSTDDLIQRFSDMQAKAPAIKKQIADCMAPLRKALDVQYDRVFSLIGVEPVRADAH